MMQYVGRLCTGEIIDMRLLVGIISGNAEVWESIGRTWLKGSHDKNQYERHNMVMKRNSMNIGRRLGRMESVKKDKWR